MSVVPVPVSPLTTVPQTSSDAVRRIVMSGSTVGADVGHEVGMAVGSGVGETVGTVDGRFVGAMVGSYVVGFTVGAGDGATVGALVGTLVGCGVGAADGEMDGAAVGALVGALVGGVVGVWVGSKKLVHSEHRLHDTGHSMRKTSPKSPTAVHSVELPVLHVKPANPLVEKCRCVANPKSSSLSMHSSPQPIWHARGHHCRVRTWTSSSPSHSHVARSTLLAQVDA
jgi:hypothetical protein